MLFLSYGGGGGGGGSRGLHKIKNGFSTSWSCSIFPIMLIVCVQEQVKIKNSNADFLSKQALLTSRIGTIECS